MGGGGSPDSGGGPGAVPGEDGLSASGAGRERIAANSDGTETTGGDETGGEAKFEAPSTPVLLGGLGGLTALLGAGFIWFSRRLP